MGLDIWLDSAEADQDAEDDQLSLGGPWNVEPGTDQRAEFGLHVGCRSRGSGGGADDQLGSR
jgi:hypothetical protein